MIPFLASSRRFKQVRPVVSVSILLTLFQLCKVLLTLFVNFFYVLIFSAVEVLLYGLSEYDPATVKPRRIR